MKAAAKSDNTTFDPAKLVHEHQAGVWRYLRALGCEASLADDITQETFLAVLQKPFDDYQPAASAAYLRRVAHNLFISHQRRSGKVLAVENIEEIAQTWSRWVGEDNGEELLLSLRNCLEQLSDRARLALEMRFEQSSSRASISDALAITEHGAKNLMQRAKKQLRSCIEGKLQ